MAISVPKLFPNATIVCLGCGPSLNAEDVAYVRGKAPVIAINAAYELAPWADVLYCCDASFWRQRGGVPSFAGLKYSVEVTPEKFGVHRLTNTGMNGLELDPSGLRTGKNSGYQAINLAVHLGASRILLLGYDLRMVQGRQRFTTTYAGGNATLYPQFIEKFQTLVEPLNDLGVEVVNCTKSSALKCFPMQSLRDALRDAMAVAS